MNLCLSRLFATIAFLLSFVVTANAQQNAAVQPVKVLVAAQNSGTSKGTTLMIPFVALPNQKAANQINDYIFITLLGMLPPKPQQIRARIVADNATEISGTTDMSYRVLRNRRILSFSVDREGCGAYCESYTTYLAFDLSDGRAILADDIFTKAGQLELLSLVGKEQTKQYRQMVQTLSKELKQTSKLADANKMGLIQDIEERLELNRRCAGLEVQQEETRSAPLAPNAFASLRFYFADSNFALVAERCSNHAMRALDDVGEVELKLPYASLRPYLTAYGRSLLFSEGSARPAITPFGQVLHGKLDHITPITMYLGLPFEDQSLGGIYFYDKYGKGIRLSGAYDGARHITLQELYGDKPTATMQLEIVCKKLRGYWQGERRRDVEYFMQ